MYVHTYIHLLSTNPYLTNIYTHTHSITHTHTYTYIYIVTNIHIEIYIYMYICTNIFLYLWIHKCISMCTCIICIYGFWARTRSQTYMFIYIYTDIHICTRIYIYIRIHVYFVAAYVAALTFENFDQFHPHVAAAVCDLCGYVPCLGHTLMPANVSWMLCKLGCVCVSVYIYM